MNSRLIAAYARALTEIARKHNPYILLLAATPQGRDLAPRLASSLGCGPTADCTDLQIGTFIDARTKQKHHNLLLQIRPAWGGNNIATIVNPGTRPQMATVREGTMQLPSPKAGARGELIQVALELHPTDLVTKIIDQRNAEKKVNLKAAINFIFEDLFTLTSSISSTTDYSSFTVGRRPNSGQRLIYFGTSDNSYAPYVLDQFGDGKNYFANRYGEQVLRTRATLCPPLHESVSSPQ